MKDHRLLIPIDEIIRESSARVADFEWEGEFERAELEMMTLKYYIKKRDSGEVYETMF